mmetsp:Transcript_17057/g.53631  ORF Transcript_17057/g.53631 Transcript_17057/m.53631 type:complete len:207 (-) Transcript_17057:7-627(-)
MGGPGSARGGAGAAATHPGVAAVARGPLGGLPPRRAAQDGPGRRLAGTCRRHNQQQGGDEGRYLQRARVLRRAGVVRGGLTACARPRALRRRCIDAGTETRRHSRRHAGMHVVMSAFMVPTRWLYLLRRCERGVCPQRGDDLPLLLRPKALAGRFFLRSASAHSEGVLEGPRCSAEVQSVESMFGTGRCCSRTSWSAHIFGSRSHP